MDTEEVRAFVAGLNEAWRRGDMGSVAACYHPDVVLLPPDLGTPIRGRDAVLATYRDFLETATLHRFSPIRLDIHSFPAGAATVHVAHLTFDVAYTLDGSRYVEQGLEVYAIVEVAGRLQIVWRQQSVLDSRLAEKSDLP